MQGCCKMEMRPRLWEPCRSHQCLGTRRGSAGETQRTIEEEGAHTWPMAGLGAASEDLSPSPASPTPHQLLGQLMSETSHFIEHE